MEESDINQRILCVDRDRQTLELLKSSLSAARYDVLTASSGEECLKAVPGMDLILMDPVLSDWSGFDLLKTLKNNPLTAPIPVIIISALDSEDDVLRAFELGVDDYVTKPFSVRELQVRIRNVLRRACRANQDSYMHIGTMSVDPKNNEALHNNEKLKLTRKEFEILCALVQNEGRVLSREAILNKVWGYDFFGRTTIVDSHIKRLRTKLGEDRRMIQTVRGVGYRIVS